uniref:CAP10 domain-containing protein n=1 Tax=Globodera pallida TaxID=36090 RepID=A0A183CQV2_GLOPA
GRGWTGRDGAGRDGTGLAGTGRDCPGRDFDYPIEVTWPPGGRVNESLDWSFEAIRMFRNESRNVLDVEGFPPKLVFSKGSVASSLSRKMAEFIVYELDLTETVRRLESGVNLGIDEILMPTLHAADALQAPGGFTRDCLERKKGSLQVQHITRAALWYDVKKCGSGHMRHAVCLFGMEDLADKMAVWPHLFANKLMPEFDFGALLCWWEKMHQRAYNETRQRSLSRLNSAIYADLPHVRFQKFAADLKKLNDAQRGTKDVIPFRKALAFFNCRLDVMTLTLTPMTPMTSFLIMTYDADAVTGYLRH